MSPIKLNNTPHTAASCRAQNNKDKFKDTPVRYLGFTNELGAAFSEVCTGASGIARHIPALSYIPAIGYISCDVFDKYKKGEDGTGEKPSVKMGARELVSQVLGSVLLPTALIMGVQKGVKAIAKKVAPKLPENIVGTFTKNNGRLGKIGTVIVSLAALLMATKPIDKLVDKGIEKVFDPAFGVKHTAGTLETANAAEKEEIF